jgi:hypothetical protein
MNHCFKVWIQIICYRFSFMSSLLAWMGRGVGDRRIDIFLKSSVTLCVKIDKAIECKSITFLCEIKYLAGMLMETKQILYFFMFYFFLQLLLSLIQVSFRVQCFCPIFTLKVAMLIVQKLCYNLTLSCHRKRVYILLSYTNTM